MTKKAARVTALLLASVGVFVLAATFPLILENFNSHRRLNWLQLSYIGQAYSAASSFLTGLALIGVAGSIALQAKAVNAGREQSSRERHARLIEMSLKDPVYQLAWGRDLASFTPDVFRQRAYLNLIVSYWQRDYQLNGLAEHGLRHSLSMLFRGEAARLWWTDVGDIRKSTSKNRRDRRFCRIIDEEFRKAVSLGPPVVPARMQIAPVYSSDRVATGGLLKTAVAVLFGATAGTILGWSRRKA